MLVSRAADRIRAWCARPWLLVLLLAPYCGEGLSGSSPPLTLLMPWHLAFMMALYGCGALICREIACRAGLGFPGLVLLGAAYGVFEEGLVDRYWYLPSFWESSGVGDYSVVFHTNVLLAAHLTVFHTAVSICLSVLVVEWLFPRDRDRPWVGLPALALAAVALASTPLLYGEFDQRPPAPVLLAAVALVVVLVLAAFRARRNERTRAVVREPRRFVGTTAFLAVLCHWIATYAVPETALPWPVGVLVALLPVAAGALAIRALASGGPYGRDAVRVGAGIVWFFVLLGLVVGVNGQYDMLLSAAATAVAVPILYRRRRSTSASDRAANTRASSCH